MCRRLFVFVNFVHARHVREIYPGRHRLCWRGNRIKEHDDRMTIGRRAVNPQDEGRSSFLVADQWLAPYRLCKAFSCKACPGTGSRNTTSGWRAVYSREVDRFSILVAGYGSYFNALVYRFHAKHVREYKSKSC